MTISNDEYVYLREQVAFWKATALVYKDVLIKNKLIISDKEKIMRFPDIKVKHK